MNAAVLRNALLGDVHLGHDFDTRHDRRVKLASRSQDFAQLAIHTKADGGVLGSRFDVNVARALARRMDDHVVHEADDGTLVGQRLRRLQVELKGIGRNFDRIGTQVGGDAIDAEVILVATWQECFDRGTERQHRPDAQSRDPFEFVEMKQVLRLGHRHCQHTAHTKQRERTERFRLRTRDRLHGGRIDHSLSQSNGGDSQLVRDQGQQIILFDQTELQKRFAKSSPFGLRLTERRFEFRLRDQTGRDQPLAQETLRVRRGPLRKTHQTSR